MDGLLNIYPKVTEFFYRVNELVTTFGDDGFKKDSFSHNEDFKDTNLLQCRIEAEKYYWERLRGFENGKYLLPFASPKDSEEGKHAAFSITFSLIKLLPNGGEIEHP